MPFVGWTVEMHQAPALTVDRIRTAMWAALREEDLWPHWDAYEAGRGRVVGWGETEIGELQRVVGRRVWRAALDGAARPVSDADVVRIVGMGRLLSEHLLAPLALPSDTRTPLARLGALANLIVALYDNFLDGRGSGTPLSRSALSADSGKRGLMLFWHRSLGTVDERLMGRLVELYYRRLQLLTPPSLAGSARLAFIHRTIRRMYDAEDATRTRSGPPSRAALRRKAALPFVVMGLPGWLVASPGTTTLFWHVGWLYRVGLFFGAIDDAVDMEADRAASHPNTLTSELSLANDPEQALQRFVRRVARAGTGLASAWLKRVPEHEKTDPIVSRAIQITTCSWLGGSGWQPWAESAGTSDGP